MKIFGHRLSLQSTAAILLSLLAFAAMAAGVLSPAEAGGVLLAAGPVAIGKDVPYFQAGAYPSVDDFRAHVVMREGVVEVVKASLYDSAVYPAAGVTAMNFFATPLGQGVSSSPGNAANPKTLQDTNTKTAGQLPAGESFWIQSIEIDFQPGATTGASWQITNPVVTTPTFTAAGIAGGVGDVNAFYSAGGLVLTIGNKPYLEEAPLVYFPPKCRFELDSALSGITNATSVIANISKLKAGGRPYVLDPGLAITPGVSFRLQLQWPAVVATISGFPGRVMVKLDGWSFRPVQ